MSEKRFEIRTNRDGEHWLFDNKYDKAMMISKIHTPLLDVCNMLNEQQATINKLKEENEELRKENKDLNDMEWEKFKKKYHLE